jgi:hypothetical protein
LTSNDAAKELCDAVDANTAADAGTVVFGYKTAGAGIGGVVTQATSRSTAVTLSTLCGQITTSSASLAAEAAAEFTVTNTQVKQGDVVALCQQSGSNGGNTDAYVSTVADGSFKVKVANNNPAAGTAETGAIILNFAIIRAVDS